MAAGKIAAQRGSVIVEADGGHRFVGVRGVCAGQCREVPDVVDDSQVVVDRRILSDIADPVSQVDRARRVPQHHNGSLRDDLRPDDAAHQGGLAASGRAEQSGDRAPCDLHRDVVEGDSVTPDNPQIVDVYRDLGGIAQ